jgi:23S rRNA (guanosine2251-2'-O)-methyltransferase
VRSAQSGVRQPRGAPCTGTEHCALSTAHRALSTAHRATIKPVSLPVVVVLDNIRSLYNTGAFFRTADACAIEQLVLCGITPRPDQGGRQQRAIAKTALGAELSVPWSYHADTAAAIAPFASRGYAIVAVETSPDALDLYEWTPHWPVCLVFGHEKDGVDEEIATSITTHVRIPMLGQKRSLNVATAGGVVIYELLRRHRYGPRR